MSKTFNIGTMLYSVRLENNLSADQFMSRTWKERKPVCKRQKNLFSDYVIYRLGRFEREIEIQRRHSHQS